MSQSMLAAVHAAMSAAGANPVLDEDATDAAASEPKEPEMANDKPAAGIPQAEHEAAVSAAETRGHEAGAKAATSRLATALGADGVRGDGARMAAALDLAQKSPSMSGEDIAAFVSANVAAGKPADAVASYERNRIEAAGQAQPGGQTDRPQATSWASFRAKRAK